MMFSFLNSDLVNPFEPMDKRVRCELDETVSRALMNINADNNSFVNPDQLMSVTISAEEDCSLCGAPWVDGVLEKLHLSGNIEWYAIEGAKLLAGDKVCTIHGKAKDIIGKEKVILDFLSFFSSISTYVSAYSQFFCDSTTLLYCDYLIIPELLFSQQYAVQVGGGQGYNFVNEDKFLVTKNHIDLLGGLTKAIQQALRHYPIDFLKVEVMSLQELTEAIKLGVKHIKLCYFALEQIAQAQELVKGQSVIEVYGSAHIGNIKQIIQIGVSKIIIGWQFQGSLLYKTSFAIKN